MFNLYNYKFMKKKWFNDEGPYRSLLKWLRIMKLTVFFILVALIHVSASVYSQQTKLNISLKDVSVKDVLRTIEDKSEFFFLYKNENIDVNRIVSVEVNDKSVEFMLDQLFKGTNVTYEVVAIGYGTQKKSDLTGAVSVVKTDELSKSSSSSISQTLAGKAAGLSVTQISSQPGGGLDLQIRGAANSSTGHDPLYIIDGFPVSSGGVEPTSGNRYEMGSRNPLNSINPNDIESIEILKDASSTAIYGARASNGVI